MGGIVKSIGKAIGSVFGGGSDSKPPPAPQVVAAPAPPPPPPPPALAPTIDAAKVAQNDRMAEFKRKGRASTILTGQQGDLSTPSTSNGTKTLLGS